MGLTESASKALCLFCAVTSPPKNSVLLCTLQRTYWSCFTLRKNRNREMKWLMGDSPSFLHRWKKPLFLWGQLMLPLSCVFTLWGWWWWGVYIPLSLLFLPSLISPLRGWKPGWQVLSHHTAGAFGVPRRKLGSCSWWLFDLSLSRAGNLYLYFYCCWSFSSFLFFTLFFPNTADETHSLFRIRQNFSPWEYGIAQGQGPVLFGAGMTGLSVIPKMWGHEKAV